MEGVQGVEGMRIEELKVAVEDGLYKMVDLWFEEPIYRAIGRTVVKANINKFDGMLEWITDADGNVMVDDIIDNIGDIEIDLTRYSSLLPRRILLLSVDDMKKIVHGGF